MNDKLRCEFKQPDSWGCTLYHCIYNTRMMPGSGHNKCFLSKLSVCVCPKTTSTEEAGYGVGKRSIAVKFHLRRKWHWEGNMAGTTSSCSKLLQFLCCLRHMLWGWPPLFHICVSLCRIKSIWLLNRDY